MEYAQQAWSPHLKKGIDLLESVQTPTESSLFLFQVVVLIVDFSTFLFGE